LAKFGLSVVALGVVLVAGSTVQWDNAIPDTRRFYTADPWGNRIELIGAN